MEIPNAIKICEGTHGYMACDRCPIYGTCSKDYPSTEEFEKAIEKAAIEYLKGKKQ